MACGARALNGRNNVKKRTCLGAAIAAALCVEVSAEPERLAGVVVTPTRTAETTDESLSSITVIDEQEIQREQPKGIPEFLQGRAGIGVTTRGAFGKDSSLHMRGTNSGHTLLLLNGVRAGSATTGAAPWQFLPPQEIERIEVVRGPRTSLYGSDAIGGVIQMFTREGDEGPPAWRAFGGGGSFGTHEYGAGVSGGTATTRYNVSGSHFHTDGIDVQDDAGDDDTDGFRNTSMSANVSHRLSDQAQLFGSSLHSEGVTKFDGLVDRTEFKHHATRVGLRGDLTDTWFSEVAFGHARDESDNFSEGEFFSQFDTKRDEVSWQNDVLLGDQHLLTLGGDWRNERVEGSDDFAETSRYNRAGFGQLQLDFGVFDAAASLRHDDNEAFGGKTTGQLALGAEVTPGVRLWTNYGTAFKAPTFNDLYYPDDGSAHGNPDLEPEESATFEVGARAGSSERYVSLAAFQSDIDQLIDWRCVEDCDDGDFMTDVWTPENFEAARIRGIELEGGVREGHWHLRGAVTYLHHEIRESENPAEVGNELRRRPRESARLSLDRDIGRFSLGGTVIARGRSYDDAGNDERIAGYGLLNLRAAYHFDAEWTLRATLENALDKDYETAAGYNQPGRAVFVSVHYEQAR